MRFEQTKCWIPPHFCLWENSLHDTGTISFSFLTCSQSFCPWETSCHGPGTIFRFRKVIPAIVCPWVQAYLLARDNPKLLTVWTRFSLSLSSDILLIRDNYKLFIYSFITSLIIGEHHVFLGLRSLQFPFVHAPVIFLISFNVLAPLFIASTICPFVTWLQ